MTKAFDDYFKQLDNSFDEAGDRSEINSPKGKIVWPDGLVKLGQEMGLEFTSGDLKNSNIVWKEAGSERFKTEFEDLLSNEASDYSNGERGKDPSKWGKYWLGSNYAEY
jgi:hypothetical protein